MREHIQGGQKEIKEKVIQNGLCTGCAACVALCPYFEHYKDNTVILHDCTGLRGRCYAYCPRTPTDLDALQKSNFDASDLTPEMGAVKALYITRAADKTTRNAAQHGGTVTALINLALTEGIIDTAVMAEHDENLIPECTSVVQGDNLSKTGKSKFSVTPTVKKFTETSKGLARHIGVVATPCQALALSKMRANAAPEDAENIAKLTLVIGLFCGWALAGEPLTTLLAQKLGNKAIHKMDIPPSKYQCMTVTTEEETVEIPLADVEACVRENCRFCFDMTCEFSDLSVGSARSADGWAVDKGWNQVIVRTETGRQLLDLARKKGVLEFKTVPGENIEKIKQASLNKKKNCLRRLIEKSGSPKDLIYLYADDPAVQFVLDSMDFTEIQ